MHWIDTRPLGFKLYCLQLQDQNWAIADPQDTRFNKQVLESAGFILHEGTGRYYAELNISTLKVLHNHPDTRNINIDKSKIIITSTQEAKHDQSHNLQSRPDTDRPVRQDGIRISDGELSVRDTTDGRRRQHHRISEQNPRRDHSSGAKEDTGTSGPGLQEQFPGESGTTGQRQENSGGRDPVHNNSEHHPEVGGSGPAEDLNPDHFFIGRQINRDGGFRASDRYRENIEATRTLKKLEKSGKPASNYQKAKLVKYNGWGGLAQVFETYPRYEWAITAKDELPELLTTEEFEAVRASVTNSHYTPPVTIKNIWKGLQKMGFEGGNIMDPALGPGNFMGFAPKEIVRQSNIVAIEKDPIAGRLAQLIYPDAKIFVQGYEKTRLPDNYFDLAITNVPFGNFSVYDSEYPELSKTAIHDYYFLKTLEKTKPEGVIAFITSSYTMDKKSEATRHKIHQKAQFLGAIRLPTNAQAAQAGTQTTTDIILLKKRSKSLVAEQTGEASWLKSVQADIPNREGVYLSEKIHVNQYFLDNPDQVIGNLEKDQGDRGRPIVRVTDCTSEELNKNLGNVFDRMAKQIRIKTAEARNATTDTDLSIGEKPTKEDQILTSVDYPRANFGAFVLTDGTVAQIVGKTDDGWVAKECDFTGRTLDRVIALIEIRDSLRELIELEKKTPADDVSMAQETVLNNARQILNEKYDAFINTFGFINAAVNGRLLNDDPDIGRIMAIENYDPEKKTATKADILTQRVIFERPTITSVDTVHDGYLACLDQLGRVDMEYIAELASVSRAKVQSDLESSRSIFFDPERQTWVTAPEYLSGDVRAKLKNARAAAELDTGDRFATNIEALETVLPKDLNPSDIFIRFGSPWVPAEVVKDFITDKMQLSHSAIDRIKLDLRQMDGIWLMKLPYECYEGRLATSVYGSLHMPFGEIFDRAMNRKSVTVKIKDPKTDTWIVNQKETLVAEQKLDKLQREYNQWLWQDPDRGARLLKIYNDKFNCYAPATYDGSHLTLPGMSDALTPRPCQKNAIWRAVLTGNILLAHEVGVGKTLELVAIAMEKKRLGQTVKPVICIPDHMLEQITREAQILYPSANILMVTKSDLLKENRRKFMGKVGNNNWDLVVMTHGNLKKIGLDPVFERRLILKEKADHRLALEMTKESGNGRRYSVKRIENAIARFDKRLAELEDQMENHMDPGLIIDDLGIDCLLIDESHKFKNLGLETPGTEVAGGIPGSQKAWGLYQKIRWLYEKRGEESGVVFASGTPVSNNIFELYNIQRYLQPSMLEKGGVQHVNAWSAAFLAPKTQWEPNASGTGWKLRTRYELINIPELMQMVLATMDVVRADDINLDRPEMEVINVTVSKSCAQEEYMQLLARRVKHIDEVDKSQDNLLKIISEGRLLSLDPKLIENLFNHAGIPLSDFELDDADHKDKIDVMVDNIIEIYHQTRDVKGTQLVFSDQGTPGGGKKYNVYDRAKKQLVEAGIPEHEIRFIHEFNTDIAKAQAFKKVREGEFRVFFGSTEKMGEGSNMQDRVAAMHDLNAPWRPSDIEQRGGRAQRFGNIFKNVKRFIYTVQDSFDLFMWGTLKHKAETFTRIMTGDTSIRRLDMAVDPTYAETMAITTGNPLIKEKLDIDQRLVKLEALEAAHRDGLYRIGRDKQFCSDRIQQCQSDLRRLQSVPSQTEDAAIWRMNLKPYGLTYKNQTEFKGDSKQAVKLVASVFKRLAKKDEQSVLKHITCGGMAVQVEKYFNVMANKNLTQWSILNKDGKPTNIELNSMPKVQEFVASVEDNIQKTIDRIEILQNRLNELENDVPAEFEHAQELSDVKALQKELERKIIELENPNKSADATAGETEDVAPSAA